MIMVNAICKYIMIVFMLLYTCNGLLSLRTKQTDSYYKKDRVYSFQMAYAMVIFLAGSVQILTHDFSLQAIIMFSAELLFLTIYPMLLRSLYPKAVTAIICDMVLFLGIGFIMQYRLSPAYAKRQLIIMVAVGIVTCWIPKFIEKLKNAKMPAAGAGIIGLVLLIFVLVLGNTSYGANLSLTLGPVSIQPNEIVKITYVLLIAMLFRKQNDFKRVCFASGVAALHVLVLVCSKDLGAALIYFLAYICMLYVATGKTLYTMIGLVSGSIASVGAYFLFAHVRVRITTWLDPWSDIANKGYQIIQSLFALGNGGLLGTGLYNGKPTEIPLVVKDFMFAAIGEELGLIFGILMIFTILACLLRMVIIAARMQTMFYRLVGIGFSVIYGVQSILTIGGSIKFIPLTGVTIPFVSYGGSSLLCMFIIFMIMLGLVIMRQNEDDQIERQKREQKDKSGLPDEDEIVVYFEE